MAIDGLLLGVYKYTPLGGSSYIPLPVDIKNKGAVVNPQNRDNRCFKWAILAKRVSGLNKERVGTKYTSIEDRYDFSGISYPTPLKDIRVFEKSNPTVSVNVFGLKACYEHNTIKHIVYPLRVVQEEKIDHHDLLIVSNKEGDSHYTCIRDFGGLIQSQQTKNRSKMIYCKRCFTGFNFIPKLHKPHGREALDQHKQICGEFKPALPLMPEPGSKLKFESWEKTQRVPFAIYADIESLLVKSDDSIGSNTQVIHEHKAMSYAFIVKAADNIPKELLDEHNIRQSVVLFRGSKESGPDEVAIRFLEDVSAEAEKIEALLKTNVAIKMSEEEVAIHTAKTQCDLCKRPFTNQNHKTADHDHLTGNFRQTMCNTCNLKLKTPKFIPCFFHNLSRYDSHFLIKQLGNINKRISVIPNTEEQFISFSKYITNTFSIRFVDSFRFMGSSLASLTTNLQNCDINLFKETAKTFTGSYLNLVTQKSFFPYSYACDWDRLDETKLPPKNEFFNDLTETHISQGDYDHAVRVWNYFNCKTLGEYSDVYLKIDTVILCDVFEAFRDLCKRTYNLDPAHYYTSPGLSFKAMLLHTRIEFELLSDYEQVLFFERGIRGGMTFSTIKHARASNRKTPGYDPEKPETWILYQDVNNSYGWSLSQDMPHSGFH